MRFSVLAFGVAVLALGLSLASGWQTRQAVDELRVEQRDLAGRIASLDRQESRRETRAPAVRVPARPSGAASGAAETGAGGAAAKRPPRGAVAGREARRGTDARVETGEPAAASLEHLLGRFESRFGRGRIEALGELERFAQAGDPAALDAVVAALSDDDPRVRAKAVGVAEDVGDPALLPHLAELIDDPDPEVREELADALEEMPMDDAGPLLLAMLDDPETDVVEEAVESLATRGWRPALPHLLRLADDPNLDVAAEAGAALRSLGEPERADRLLRQVAQGFDSADPQLRREALYRVKIVGGLEARPYYEALLHDSDAYVRRLAREGLDELRP